MGDIYIMEKGQMTGQQILDKSGKSPDAIRKKLVRLAEKHPDVFPDASWNLDRVFSPDQSKMLAGRVSARRPAKKSQTVSTPSAKDQPGATPAPSRYRAGDWIRSDRFLVVVMCLSLLAQMIHTAGFFFHNSPIQEPFDLNIILCILFAIGVDCTALVLTAWRGGWGYIAGFALIHFAMNLNFHWEQHDKAITFGQILLSFVIAVSNFSYIELFSKRFEQ